MLVVETLAIQKVVKAAIRMKMDNVLVESDSQVTTFTIMDKTATPKHISVLIDDIKCIARNVKNIIVLFIP